MGKVKFIDCEHNWDFQISVDQTGGPAAGNSLYRCQNCNTSITLIEKCALDQTKSQEISLEIQERHTKTGMLANIISAILLIIAFLTFLLGDKLIQ